MNGHEIVTRIDELLWSQRKKKKDLFIDCKITSSAYSQWNTGKSNPSIKKLSEIAEYLHTSVEYLISGVETKKDLSVMSDEEVDREMYEILSEIKSNPDIRALMKSAKGSSKENLQAAAKMLEYYKNGGADAD